MHSWPNMRVVSNTSPIAYLTTIGYIDLLPRLFGTVTIPKAVQNELTSPNAPLVVQRWINAPPGWIVLQSAPTTFAPELHQLDAGERAAIALAEAINADLILLDDLAARRVAASRGLALTGVLGVLDRAAAQGWIDIHKAIDQLRQTNFRTSSTLLEKLLQKYR